MRNRNCRDAPRILRRRAHRDLLVLRGTSVRAEAFFIARIFFIPQYSEYGACNDAAAARISGDGCVLREIGVDRAAIHLGHKWSISPEDIERSLCELGVWVVCASFCLGAFSSFVLFD